MTTPNDGTTVSIGTRWILATPTQRKFALQRNTSRPCSPSLASVCCPNCRKQKFILRHNMIQPRPTRPWNWQAAFFFWTEFPVACCWSCLPQNIISRHHRWWNTNEINQVAFQQQITALRPRGSDALALEPFPASHAPPHAVDGATQSDLPKEVLYKGPRLIYGLSKTSVVLENKWNQSGFFQHWYHCPGASETFWSGPTTSLHFVFCFFWPVNSPKYRFETTLAMNCEMMYSKANDFYFHAVAYKAQYTVIFPSPSTESTVPEWRHSPWQVSFPCPIADGATQRCIPAS